MSNPQTSQPDFVFIFWQVQEPNATRRIVEATIIGSAHPCERFLEANDRLSRARDCLLENGFRRVFQERLDDFGVSVFIRTS